MTTTTTRLVGGLVLLGSLLLPTALQAQLASASARHLGLGQNGMATARAFQSVAANPAGLGMAESSGFSLALAPVRVRTGIQPVDFADLKDVEGSVISAATKEGWLRDVANAGGESGAFGVRFTGVALQLGRLGVQVSTLASGQMNLSPGLVELLLYGNAGRTGQPVDLTIGPSSLAAYGATTAGVSYGFPLPTEQGEMALGATLTYSVGHAVAVADGGGGTVRADPVSVDVSFPTLLTDDEDTEFNQGSGVGLDLGFMMKRDRVSFGAAVRNLVHSFSWDVDKLVYRRGTASLALGDNETDFERQSASAAPAELRARIDEMTFEPTLALGGGYDVSPDFTAMVDVRNRFGDGMDVGPAFHAGVGGEYRGLEALHLRAGSAVISDGFQLGGGGSLILGPVNLSLAVAVRDTDTEQSTLGQFTLSFGHR